MFNLNDDNINNNNLGNKLITWNCDKVQWNEKLPWSEWKNFRENVTFLKKYSKTQKQKKKIYFL